MNTNKIAIMQPYFLPYIGYFDLIRAVDTFVIYDDVNFIKGGWINRNKIIINTTEFLFTVPIKNMSSFKKINETMLHESYFKWKNKFLKTLKQSYSKSKNFNSIYFDLENIFTNKNIKSISQLNLELIILICKIEKIETEIIKTSSIFENSNLKGQERVIDICKRLNATHYINSYGGKELYNQTEFKKRNLELEFMPKKEQSYSIIHDLFTK